MAPEVVQRSPSPKLQSSDEGNVATMGAEHVAMLSDDNKASLISEEATKSPGQDEVPSSLQRKIIDTQYFHDAETLLQKERDDGTLATRSKQAILYLSYTELRIQELEMELYKVKQDLHNLPDDFELQRARQHHPVYRHLLQHSSPSQFRLSKTSWDIPREERAALEVLTVEHIEKKQQHSQGGLMRRSTDLESDQARIQHSPERLRIRSRPLVMHLQKVTATQISDDLYVPGTEAMESSMVFLSPFKLFVMFEKEIRQSISDLEATMKEDEDDKSRPGDPPAPKRMMDKPNFDNKDLLEDLKMLIQFMDEDLKPTFDLRQRIEEGTAETIAYADLWHLFHRGDYVLIQSDTTHAYKVLHFTGGREPLTERLTERDDTPTPVDGFSYLGRVPITSLAVYPLKFDPNVASKRKEFMEQGRQYIDLTIRPFVHKHFVGKTLDEPSHNLDAQVIVDMTLAIHSNPDWKPKSKISMEDLTEFDQRETKIVPYCFHDIYNEGCCGSDIAFKDWQMDQMRLSKFAQENGSLFAGRDAKGLTEDELMLLPTWVYGFVLRTRRWATLRISDLSEVKFENDFKNLMLSEEYKSTIKALVATHENSRDGSAELPASSGSVWSGIDLVRGKGTGLILLLHGAPGVGKTSTAECVADNTKRPLFPVTCGDIGETATEVETRLQQHFQLAHKWGCVLLLDEADVFLAKRTRNDLRRNAVTSVFLRSLEYYAGILFLTTNRVGNIDPAFKSRIHLSLLYQPFNLKTTRRLYEIFVDRTRAEQKRRGPAHFVIKRKEILEFAKDNYREMKGEGLGAWNGRQIRNAFQAAISLAEHEYQKKLVKGKYPEGRDLPELGRSQLATVADRSKEFEKYLISTLGMDESDLAYEEQWRADQFARGARAALAPKKEKRAAPAAATVRHKGKANNNAPAVTSSEDEESLSEDDGDDEDEDDDEGDGKHKEAERANDGHKPDDSDLDDEEELEAIRELLRRKKKKKAKN
ncbi:P-loop containing nucleoside triphosphate hydrolase protein [Apiospora rasikravindrae]|uniref:P-loop containing nucleoside triphosphate hydrolase protein n=1 Tax=Apiospora rasikravindrae TaxID=990691 RepID=A0ABR1SE95_9PEZI